MKHVLLICALLLAGCQGQGGGDDPLPPTEPTGEASVGGASAPTMDLLGQGGECGCPTASNGTSCTVEQTGDGARISCEDGTSALVSNGSDGSDGLDGSAAARGETGPQGPPGESIVGPAGPPGADGMSIVGPVGMQGPAGPPGSDGQSITGPQGLAGLKGDKGDPGADGTGISASSVYQVVAPLGASSPGDLTTSAACTDGDMVLYGGCSISNSSTGVLQQNFPVAQDGMQPWGWYCYAVGMQPGGQLTAIVGCLITQ